MNYHNISLISLCHFSIVSLYQVVQFGCTALEICSTVDELSKCIAVQCVYTCVGC